MAGSCHPFHHVWLLIYQPPMRLPNICFEKIAKKCTLMRMLYTSLVLLYSEILKPLRSVRCQKRKEDMR
jgi:hypothetical protein